MRVLFYGFRNPLGWERVDSGSLLTRNFHCKGVAFRIDAGVHVLQFSGVRLWHHLVSDALIQFIPWYSAEAFFQPMNTQCISCCSFLHLSYSCLRVEITPLSVVDVLFVITNCSSHIFTMFLSRFSCTLT